MRLFALLLVGLASAASAQTTRYVAPTGIDAGACDNPATPCRTVAYALEQAADGDTLQLAAGSYTEDGGLIFDKSVEVEGAGLTDTVLQEAAERFEADARLVTVLGGVEVRLAGVTLRHSLGAQPGVTAPGGGAVWNEGTLTLDNVLITYSYASQVGEGGGAILNRPGATLSAIATTFKGNMVEASPEQGGGALKNQGTATLEDCLIVDNDAHWQGRGGGILNMEGAELTLIETVISTNRAGYSGAEVGHGGGLYNLGVVTMIGGEVRENRSGFGIFFNEGGDGGGLYNRGVLTLEDVLVTENATLDGNTQIGFGGGLYNTAGGVVTIRGSTFSRNRTGNAGGVFPPDACPESGDGGGIYSLGTLVLAESTVEDNATGDGGECGDNTRGGNGGGLYVAGPTTILASTIAENETGVGSGLAPMAGDGAGIYVRSTGSLDLIESTVSENRIGEEPIGGYGSALVVGGTVRVVNSTISGNLSEVNSNGGGTVVMGGSDAALDLVASTITANRSASVGGLWVIGGADAGSVRIRNSILAGNEGSHADCSENSVPNPAIQSFGHNLLGEVGFCAEAFPVGFPNANDDYVGTDAQPIDPVLGPLADNGGPTLTHALEPGSLAIDHGACTDLDGQPIDVDQRGFTRVAPCDIGAFEHDGIPTGTVPSAALPDTHRLTPVYPNPFNPRAAFTLEVTDEQRVRVTLMDALGRRVATLHNGPMGAGTVHRLGVEADGLASGFYVVVVEGETFRDRLPVTLLR